jgi:hypothetical protein
MAPAQRDQNRGDRALAHTCVATRRAHRYLRNLADRWRDHVVVAFEPDAARIDLPAGPCFISAEPGSLAILVEADDERRLEDLQWAIGARLERLGRAEGLRVVWARADPHDELSGELEGGRSPAEPRKAEHDHAGLQGAGLDQRGLAWSKGSTRAPFP